jgi:N-acetylglutamate synthase-like GNAT family acetyltransferase
MNRFTISDDKNKLDINLIHKFLSGSYWAKERTLEQVARSVENSLCFGLYSGEKQIGFARVLTDFVTIAYLMDVFIVEDYRGKGLSKILLDRILNDERFSNVKKWMLATADAHSLYEKFGFSSLMNPEKFMEKINPGKLFI